MWGGDITDTQAPNRRVGRPNQTAILAGLIGLGFGFLFYFMGRPKGATYLQNTVPSLDRMFPYIPNPLGGMTGSSPSFLHPFSFSLMGMGLISQTRRSRILVCSIFLLLNLFFEMGQRYKKIAVEAVPHWVETMPVLTNIKRYFLKGTFSASDLIAACLGSAAALLVAEIIAKQVKGKSDT